MQRLQMMEMKNAGNGNGFVTIFNTDGSFVKRLKIYWKTGHAIAPNLQYL